MAELKTKKTSASVESFMRGIPDPQQREDSYAVMRMMQEVTKEKPKMWGESMVGFGDYHYKYESGHEGDCFITGFAPRKGNLTLYIMTGFDGSKGLLSKLGKHKTGKSCLYIKKLEDVDMPTLKRLVKESVAHITKSPSRAPWRDGTRRSPR